MSEENAQASSDDMAGLSGFFFYVFIVHPSTAWILRPGRFERKKSIMYAIGFLALLAAVKTGESFGFRTYVHFVNCSAALVRHFVESSTWVPILLLHFSCSS